MLIETRPMKLSKTASRLVRDLAIGNEQPEQTIERLIEVLMWCYDNENLEEHFGKQRPKRRKVVKD